MSLRKEPLDLRKVCGDCHEVYKYPRLLPCSHVLCKQSALDMLETARQNNTTAKCPICNSVVDITDLADLPPMGLVDIAEDEDGILKECVMCDKRGVQYCKTCNVHMCLMHADEHVAKKSDHQIIPTAARKKDIYVCPLHAPKEFTKFCTTCLEPVCNDCLGMNKHKNHPVMFVHEAFEKFQDIVSSRPDKMEYFKHFEAFVMDILRHHHQASTTS